MTASRSSGRAAAQRVSANAATVSRADTTAAAGLVGASLAVPSLLVGCGGDAGSGGAAGGKLEFWWNPSVESAKEMTAWMDSVIKEFTAANSGTSVASTTQPSEQLVSNFRTACQSKSGPDLDHQYSGPYTMQYVWEKCIAPLDGTLDAEEMKHVLPPQALERTYLAIHSPAVRLPPGTPVRITGWFRLADGIGASADGALLFDSAGNDLFFGRGALGRLSGAGFSNSATGFGLVRAFGDSGGVNTLDIAGLTYTFQTVGTWV